MQAQEPTRTALHAVHRNDLAVLAGDLRVDLCSRVRPPGTGLGAQKIFTIGIYSIKYFWGPKNRSRGPESRGGREQYRTQAKLGLTHVIRRGLKAGPPSDWCANA